MDYSSDEFFVALFTTILAVRFFLPFAIFRYPLPAIIGCLIVDAADQSIFQHFGYDPPFYQSYDKAMDVFYLAIAYISTMRNWTSLPAYNVSQFLFYYRQFGVSAFELTQVRALLIIFPNTFEYFFIAYEAIRSRWNPNRFVMRFWVLTAAFIWIFIKLPQEYWIHIAQLDFTDTWEDVPWFAPLVVTLVVSLLLILWFVVRPRLQPADHAWQIAAPPIDEAISTNAQRAEWVAAHSRVWSTQTLAKSALIGLLTVIFASVLPDLDISPARLIIWISIFVVINASMSIALAQRGWSARSNIGSFIGRLVVNMGLVTLVDGVFYQSLPLRDALFFALLFSVLITAFDRYWPVHDYRFADGSSEEFGTIADNP